MKFVKLRGGLNTKVDRQDQITMAQENPMGWWKLHGDSNPLLHILSIFLLSHVVSFSYAERNWLTYNFIHLIKRNMLTSRHVEKLVVVHTTLHL